MDEMQELAPAGLLLDDQQSRQSPTRHVRVIALYLPQYHPVPENDLWWGPGFSEWTNLARARRLYPGHDQPRIPADLGFYDLRLAETRAHQALLAKRYGIEGFCYYHYWFAGRRLLDRPFREVLSSGEPDYPFCLCWANQSWTGVWYGETSRTLVEQTYPGEHDHREHFASLLPAFRDRRYITVAGKPVFLIYRPDEIPALERSLVLWRQLAADAGLPGLHLVAVSWHPAWDGVSRGFDAVVPHLLPRLRAWFPWSQPLQKGIAFVRTRLLGLPTMYRYARVAPSMIPKVPFSQPTYPCVLPNWDNTPRSGPRGLVLHGATPELFGREVTRALKLLRASNQENHILIVKSWNEWAEGNYLEPDRRHGHGFLQALKAAIGDSNV